MQVQTRQGPAYGVARLTLAPNEPVRVESGAMMAMSGGVALSSKAEGGIMKSLKRAALGGEGYVFDFSGPGRVWTQTRNPTEFLGWIQATLGTSNSGTGGLGGIAGGLLGRD